MLYSEVPASEREDRLNTGIADIIDRIESVTRDIDDLSSRRSDITNGISHAQAEIVKYDERLTTLIEQRNTLSVRLQMHNDSLTKHRAEYHNGSTFDW